ncbi:MAG: DNA repair protein RadC [Candidatus Omnitrophica bacterium]|nr:DNA repair protein RadC [Candidatus Omnitrophota bacterium]
MSENKYPSTICHWPHDDRPREKLAKYGEQSLSNSELLAILIRTGIKGESAVDLARKILNQFKTFRDMSDAHISHWKGIKGLGPAKISQIKAALEIGRRFREDEQKIQTERIKSSADVVAILMPSMRDLKKEIFKTIHLNASHQIINIIDESKGTVNYTTPIIREIFQKALEHFSVSIICAHNHPSGDIQPSREDRDFTRKLTEAGRIMQISVLDHLIIGDNCYFSFADKGEMS